MNCFCWPLLNFLNATIRLNFIHCGMTSNNFDTISTVVSSFLAATCYSFIKLILTVYESWRANHDDCFSNIPSEEKPTKSEYYPAAAIECCCGLFVGFDL